MDSEPIPEAELAEQRPVVAFLAPYHTTTRGHRTIHEVVRTAAGAAGAAFYPTYSVNQSTWDLIVRLRPEILIVDFPDHNIREEVEALKIALRFAGANTKLYYLYMHTRMLPIPRIHPATYDCVIAVEPGLPPGDYDLQISPLIHPDRITSCPTRVAVGDFVLAIQTGNGDEQQQILDFALRAEHQKRARRDLTVLPSLQLSKPAVGHARFAERVYTAAGYSTFWELACQQTEAYTVPVTWVPLLRPLEDIDARIASREPIDGTLGLASLTALIREALNNGGERNVPNT